MQRVDLLYAQANLEEILAGVESGREVVITRSGQDFAHLTRETASKKKKRIPLKELAEFRATMPRLRTSSAKLLRQLRDEGY